MKSYTDLKQSRKLAEIPILDLEDCSIMYSGTDIYVDASNPIDACYKLIIELHKLKLL